MFRTELTSSYVPRIENMPLDRFVEEIGTAGFNLLAELRRRDHLQNRFGRERGDLIWASGVTDEITEHAFEYSRGDIVRYPPSYEFVDGHLFSGKFNANIGEITNSKERGGSVTRGLSQVEKYLEDSPPGSRVIWTSPAGPLGIGDLEYDYSWTHVFSRNGLRVNYVSLRSDFNLSEHAGFLNLFLPQDKQLAADSLGMPAIQKILETPAVVLPNSGINSLADIGKVMSFVRANYSSTVYHNEQTGKRHSFDEMVADLKNIEEKRTLELQAINDIVKIFEGQLLREDQTNEQTVRIMGQYLLAMNYFLRHGYSDFSPSTGFNEKGIITMLDHANSWLLINDLQKVGGCAGGTTKQNTRTFTSHLSEKKSRSFRMP